jgi:hypothetical protein
MEEVGMPRKFSIGGKSVMFACVAAALFLLNSPVSTQSPSQTGGDDVANFVGPVEPDVFTTLVGGSVLAVRLRNSDTPITAAPAPGYATVPGATMPWTVGAGGSDLIDVSFNSECQLRRNGAAVDAFDWIEVQAIITAAPARAGYPKLMSPLGAGTPRALCGSETYNSVTARWTDRPTPVAAMTTYTVYVQWKVVDNPPLSAPALTGWLDDYEIKLEAYN